MHFALSSPILGEPFFINCVFVNDDSSFIEFNIGLLVMYKPRNIPTIIGIEIK